MNCRHVLDVIDAESLVDVSSELRSAAREHARGCPTCGPALKTAEAVTADLAELAWPAPPADLSRSVLARISRIEHPRSATASAGWESTPAVVRGWPGWTAVLNSVGAGLTIAIFLRADANDGVLPAVLSSSSLIAIPGTAAGAMLLLMGAAIYLGGMFAPLLRPDRGQSRD